VKNKKNKADKKSKGTSQKKIEANRKNSERSTGPKTETGKLRSRMNAMKHGIFVCELKVSDKEKPEFDLVQRPLLAQLKPASILQQVAFERVVCSAWRCKLAIRLETKRWTVYLDPQEGQEFQDEAPLGKVPTNWYGARIRDLNTALRFLAEMREDVATNGWIHAEGWKDRVTRIFGPGYYELLTQWLPMDTAAIQAALQLSAHARNFDMPLPSQLATDGGTADPSLSWQMGIKLIDLMRQHLDDLAKMKRLGADGLTPQHSAAALDLAARYVTTTARELERAVNWLRYLKKKRL
jgi:hypothetical protein